ncbi:uncharacterized protein LOC124127245 isoform X1 [Haliotis rufescens]|uniref:uncharacterized protein LOC124127245 isoform X1 n=2 Tax=Haliotis rufescens TaxID=6454 RepID=UPI00201F21EE|nr:uncharacterized protein LOC124127245 isoform X1 [Haliotis rufescens]
MNGMEMTRFATGLTALYTIFCTSHITAGSPVRTTVDCQASKYINNYQKIFSISIEIFNVTVVQLEKKKDPVVVPNDKYTISNITGQLTDNDVYIRGTAFLECELASTIYCVVYGYSDSAYTHVRFKPDTEFDVTWENVSITRRRVLFNDSRYITVLTCALEAGSRTTEMWWQSRSSDETFLKLDPRSYNVTRRVGPGCHVHVLSELRQEAGEGQSQFKCMFGAFEVGSVAVGETNQEPDNILSSHLFLSTGFLVYPHFVILPPFCDFLQMKNIIPQNFRDPKTTKSRKRRAWISLITGIIFLVWWIIVIQGAHTSGYVCFLVMESLFFILYAVVRLLPESFEKDGERLLYNCRVALSCGAVITPGICWMMIRTQMQLDFSIQEGVWLVVTAISLIAFVSVSNKREWKSWDKRS